MLVWHVCDGADEIVGWSELRRPPVRIDERPVLEVGITVADESIEHEAAHEFHSSSFASFGPQHFSDVAVARLSVLVCRIQVEDLSEILDVHPIPSVSSIETADG